ncbi:ABC transporter ATP-binding protein [Kiloniella litopenaei]|uniref:ABC transporter ATP-binding protein n=1 Tax=Kiloniella litopenaei TaxID=1549748 RepID=A0A0M2R6Y5_9PROT|nr:ATP-binding cassette domain-containing protein [Kiloniella litopenaei]KKJ75765.1 ABC transporter ATP-binding protein [Kiloniella litopenaei]
MQQKIFQQDAIAATAPSLHLKELALSLRSQQLFSKLSLSISPGEIVTIMGPSGCGKSSLLAAISGTLERDFALEGQVLLDELNLINLPPEERHIGMLFQEDLLFPHMSVNDNLGFGIPAHIKDKKKRNTLIAQALDEAGLSEFENRDPATLSGGQRARIAVLRTLLSQPRALLLDEPFSKLDAELRARFRNFVFRHARANNLPTLMVTHDPDDAQSTGGKVIQMSDL